MQNNRQCFEAVSDEELVRRSQSGDKDAFSELTLRHYTISFRLAISIVRDRESAEEEVQNAYWKAFQHIDQFHSDAKFSTWMTRIVVNQCLMRLRRERRAKFFYVDDAQIGEERGSFELTDPTPTPETACCSQQLSALLKREIGRIPPLLRNVFVLRDVNEMPMPEVAEKLGISVAAAKSRLLRARAELRQRLEKHGGGMGTGTLST